MCDAFNLTISLLIFPDFYLPKHWGGRQMRYFEMSFGPDAQIEPVGLRNSGAQFEGSTTMGSGVRYSSKFLSIVCPMTFGCKKCKKCKKIYFLIFFLGCELKN